MKISLKWLRELVETPASAEEIARRLTAAGLEVESVTPFADFSGVIVAEVRGKMPHPDAAKLTLVDVWDGREVTRVVCGAPNVPEPGARVIWARPGSKLPGGIEIAAKPVRGIVSPGMLCAEDELGIGTSHEGILVLHGGEPGSLPGETIDLRDDIFEVNVTPNRPDCLGHIGIAREVAALTGGRLILPAAPEVSGPDRAQVDVEDVEGCPRYTALLFDGIRIAPSPLAVRARLQSLGVRSISNVVDATNLVLLETGQPLHAFDLDQLAGGRIVVRRAKPGEKMHTLDGVERTLSTEDVTICDADKPVAVGGVMGGATSEVSASTTRVLLESAYFMPSRVRRTGKRLGLHTEASHRFERGVDPNGALFAALRCARLFAELAGARATATPTDLYPRPMAPARLSLRPERTRALLGADIADDEQVRCLSSLTLPATLVDGRIEVEVPTRRPDLLREVDLIEEVARLHGYDRILPTIPALRSAPPAMPGDARAAVVEQARDTLSGLGLEEMVSYHFVPPSILVQLSQAPAPVRVANPLREEQSAMRTTLVAGLLLALQRNLLRGVGDVRLFEVGDVFVPRERSGDLKLDTGIDERRRVAGLLHGHRDGWLTPGGRVDFTDLKGVVAELLSSLGHEAQHEAGSTPWLHPGVQARVLVGGRPVGVWGELHPDLARALELPFPPLLFELDLGALGPTAPPVMRELPRFPAVVRDLSFFVAAELPARVIEEKLLELRDPLCVEVQVLEDYREAGRVPEGQKSMLWSLTYRAADRTLTDAEVETVHEALRQRLAGALQVRLR
jgi:phenylalanyl-tRNA synthetase beta chain